MKSPVLLALIASLLALPLVRAVGPTHTEVEAGVGKVTVSFPHWEKYDDIQDDFLPSDQGQLNILKEMERSVDDLAGRYIPDGDHLTLTFTNIDLAGEYLAQHRDRRTFRSIYPPRLVFTYSLAGADGQMIKSGKEDLSDDLYLEHMPIDRSDPRLFEKALLKDWMTGKLRAP